MWDLRFNQDPVERQNHSKKLKQREFIIGPVPNLIGNLWSQRRNSEGTQTLETTKSATGSETERMQRRGSYQNRKEGFRITPL